jgi:hypothetical protein
MQSGSWGLTFMILVTTAFRYVIAADVVWEYILQEPCLTVIIPKFSGSHFSLYIPPDGRKISSVFYLVFTTDEWSRIFTPLNSDSRWFSASSVWSVLPMGVAPEAIVEYLCSSIVSNIPLLSINVIPTKTSLSFIFFVGWAFSAPDGSSPRGYNGGACSRL